MPGMGELLIILLIVMLIFGAGKLPAIGDSLGRSIKNFKRAAAGDTEIEVSKKPALVDKKKGELKAADDDDADLEDDAEVEAARRALAKAEAKARSKRAAAVDD